MPDTHEQIAGRNAFLAIDDHRLKLPVPAFQVRHLRGKAHRPAQPDDFLPDILHNIPQQIRSDMGLVQIADFLRRTSRNKGLQHGCHRTVIDTGGELAIGKSSGSAFPKLHIGPFIQNPPLPEAIDSRVPLIHILPALQYQRLPACPGQCQSCEHPRRTKAHDHRAQLIPPGGKRNRLLRLRLFQGNILIPAKMRQHCFF